MNNLCLGYSRTPQRGSDSLRRQLRCQTSQSFCYSVPRLKFMLTMQFCAMMLVNFIASGNILAFTIQDTQPEGARTAALPETAIAQPGQQNPTGQPSAATGQSGEEVEIPAPENLTLDTSDGVVLHCTYFGAPQNPQQGSGKSKLCFILLHDWSGSRQDLLRFGQYLQEMDSAVIVPDLRGHGESTTMSSSTTTLDYKKFRKSEMASVAKDIERCKKYLVQRNNDGELNIDMLNIVAVGETAVLAIKWTIADWFAFPPVQGGIKQGQDVKSLILISPRKRMNGLNINSDVKHPLFAGKGNPNLPTYIIWSANDEESVKDGTSIFETMQRGRPDVSGISDPAERDKQTTLYQAAIPRTNASGTELIRDGQANGLWWNIAQFVGTQIYPERESFPWQSRERD